MFYRIERAGPGWLATMHRPEGGDRLAGELAALRAAGAGVLVCALTEAEAVHLDLTAERPLAEAAGLEFVPAPISDLGLPDAEPYGRVVRLVADRLAAGSGVVCHCYAGIGRSSMLAAGALVLEGVEPDDAWARISTARGLQVPDLPAQREWLAAWAARRRNVMG